MGETLVITSAQRLDVLLHKGTVELVDLPVDDVGSVHRLEVVSPDGHWRLIAIVDTSEVAPSLCGQVHYA
jgi:hypothetical protein